MIERAIPAAWPVEGLEHLGACPVCGGRERRVLHEQLQDLLFSSPTASWTLYRCASCGVAYLDPRPDARSLWLAYSHYFTHTCDGLDPLAPARGMRALKNLVLRQYLPARHRPLRLVSRPAAWLMHLYPRACAGLETTMRFLPAAPTGGSLLDIGCGNGSFMTWARTAGWRCVGTEVDDEAARVARERGFEVRVGPLWPKGPDRFDAVTISHVIEHVHHPLQLLCAARALLKPNGFFWIETPNIDSHGHACFGRHWRGLEPPRHLQLFHPALLRSLLLEAGFREIRAAPVVAGRQVLFAASAAIARRTGDIAVVERCRLQLTDDPAVAKPDVHCGEFITLIATC